MYTSSLLTSTSSPIPLLSASN
jgi:hypothetical protein